MKLWLFVLISVCSANAQTYAERLGWKPTDRVVILHVDDAGMSHESNLGVEQATSKGIANSFSVMMPCPWVPEIIHYLKSHPDLDAGLHLTLTSEWKQYRWGPVAGKLAVPGLVDPEGDLWSGVDAVALHASASEVEKEIRAQLDRAIQFGFHPTHLDTHMGTLYATPAYTAAYVRAGIENHIPIMFPGGHDTILATQSSPDLIVQAQTMAKQVWAAGLPVLDDLHNLSYDWKPPAGSKLSDKTLQDWKVRKYEEAFHSLKPGVTMIIMHCTDASDHFREISTSGPTRRADLLAMLSPELRAALNREHIILTTWRELARRRDAVKN